MVEVVSVAGDRVDRVGDLRHRGRAVHDQVLEIAAGAAVLIDALTEVGSR